jgi:hypothetical protein
VRKILEHEQHPRLGVLDLSRQLAGGVERIDVHHRIAGAQDAEEDGRVGHDVRQHDRHPIALLQSLGLQPGCDRVRVAAEIGVSHALAETLHRRTLGVVGDARTEDVDEGAETALGNRRRDLGRVMPQPGLAIGRRGRVA